MAPQGLGEQHLHFIMFPLMAQGHTLPMIDMSILFAQRGVIITIVTTPLNSLRFNSITDRAIQSGLPIRLLKLQFPSVEVGLPKGCENCDELPSRELVKNFIDGTAMLQQPLEQSIAEMEPRPNCIISDMCFPWTNETARKFDIPRIVFHGTCCFYLLCSHNILLHKPHEKLTSKTQCFVVPGLPDRVEINRASLPVRIGDSSADVMRSFYDEMRRAELNAYGVVVNSVECLEPKYVEEYRKVKRNKVWCIGPVSLCHKDDLDKADRGNKASNDDHLCLLHWLDTKEPGSVVYVCFGSLSCLTPKQLIEVGLGLEASNRPFIWVIRKGKKHEEFERWLCEEGFEERIKDRGLIIKGWAPQVLILSHKAIGGFLTHCGWNSTLEGICAGVPMITWPMFAEQFFNEKLIIQILGIGVRVGMLNGAVQWGEEEKVGVLVNKEDVEKAVHAVMEKGEVGEMRRQKARELGGIARKAPEESESSHLNITAFIQEIMQYGQR